MLSHGSIVNFPSITWPSHSTILTGAWCGHHDVVNPTFHLREHRETVPIQGNVFETERYLSPDVETLYEVFKRVGGPARSQRRSMNRRDAAPITRRSSGGSSATRRA